MKKILITLFLSTLFLSCTEKKQEEKVHYGVLDDKYFVIQSTLNSPYVARYFRARDTINVVSNDTMKYRSLYYIGKKINYITEEQTKTGKFQGFVRFTKVEIINDTARVSFDNPLEFNMKYVRNDSLIWKPVSWQLIYY